MKVDVSSLAEDFGGEYMARLQVVRFRACALTTPTKPECLVRTPVDSGIGASGMLEADLDVGDDGESDSLQQNGWLFRPYFRVFGCCWLVVMMAGFGGGCGERCRRRSDHGFGLGGWLRRGLGVRRWG